MKKNYITPETEVVEINGATAMLCNTSPTIYMSINGDEDPAEEGIDAL